MVGAVAGRPVTMPVQPVLARQESIEGVEQVVVGASPDLDDDETRGRVRHEDREQPVAGIDIGEERRAGGGQVGQAAGRTGPDGELAGVYGKMLRSASRIRPRPPMAGTDS